MNVERATTDRQLRTLEDRRASLLRWSNRPRLRPWRSTRETSGEQALRDVIVRFNDECRDAGRQELAIVLSA